MIDSSHTWPMVILGAVVGAGSWAYSEITHTSHRVTLIEESRTSEVEHRHDVDIDNARSIARLETKVDTMLAVALAIRNGQRAQQGLPPQTAEQVVAEQQLQEE